MYRRLNSQQADDALAVLFKRLEKRDALKFYLTNRFCPPGVDLEKYLGYVAAVKEEATKVKFEHCSSLAGILLGILAAVYMCPMAWETAWSNLKERWGG